MSIPRSEKPGSIWDLPMSRRPTACLPPWPAGSLEIPDSAPHLLMIPQPSGRFPGLQRTLPPIHGHTADGKVFLKRQPLHGHPQLKSLSVSTGCLPGKTLPLSTGTHSSSLQLLGSCLDLCHSLPTRGIPEITALSLSLSLTSPGGFSTRSHFCGDIFPPTIFWLYED